MTRLVVFVTVTLLASTAGSAQTRSVRDTATAYGVRLNAKGQRADLNPARVNNRIGSRLENRLSLRIERYRPETTDNPTAAFHAPQDDNSRLRPVAAPPPQQVDTP